MHMFPALVGKLRRDVTDDKEMLRDWDFPSIHRTVDSDSGCLEAGVIMVYCAAFDYNENSSKNRVAYSWFHLVPTSFKSQFQEPLKAVGAFFLVSMPEEVKYPHKDM